MSDAQDQNWKALLTCFPCVGKRPRFDGWQKSATRNRLARQKWEAEGFNTGILQGEPSEQFTLDLDPRHGADKTLAALEKENGSLPETYTVRTGGGGEHRVFKHPGFRVPNDGQGKILGPGLDIKGEGGYIIAPGSTHPDTGNKYEVLIDREPAEAPEWLLKKIRDHVARKENVSGQGSFPEGSRNVSLTSVAGLFRRFGLEGETLFSMLSAQNQQRCNPPLSEAEVRVIADSVSRMPSHPAPDFRATDTWVAEKFAEQHRDVLRFCPNINQWYVWDGTRWSPDALDRVSELIKIFIRSLTTLAASVPEDDLRGKILKLALQCESASKRLAIESVARREASLKILSSEFDRDPWLLNVNNGTFEMVDKKTVVFREHRREDFISKLAPVTYNPEARCPRWDRFLDEVFPGQPNVIRFLQKSIGYTLTGSIREAVMWLLRGTGRNGKGTFIKIVSAMLGDYAIGAKIQMFLMKSNEQGGPRDGRFQLIGKRFVYAAEPAQGQKLNAENMKELTDPDGKLSAGKLYSTEDVPFDATQKYWLASNNDLVIRGDDQAMWDRIRRVDFTQRFADNPDRNLKQELLSELDGIFNWAVEGLRLYLLEGLKEPEEVKEATLTYQMDQDQYGRFLEVARHPDTKSDSSTVARVLWLAYKKWAEGCGEHYDHERLFAQRMAPKFPIEDKDWKKTKFGKVYLGFKLKPEFEWQGEEQ